MFNSTAVSDPRYKYF